MEFTKNGPANEYGVDKYQDSFAKMFGFTDFNEYLVALGRMGKKILTRFNPEIEG